MKNEKFSKKLKELRLSKKLTGIKLGEILGVSKGTVSVWEKGSSLPPTETMQKISEFFDISIDELLGNKPPEDNAILDVSGLTEDQIKVINSLIEMLRSKNNG